MPPKKDGKGSSKKAKLAAKKAEAAAEKQRLEEERLRLEEEERLRKIEEARLAAEAEAARQARLVVKRASDVERIAKEVEDDAPTEGAFRAKKEALEHEQAERVTWEKVFRCDTLPDATDEPDLNSYLTLWREETAGAARPWQAILADCQAGEDLQVQLDAIACAARQVMDEARVQWAIGKSREVAAITQAALDALTATLLVEADRDGATTTSSILKQSGAADALKYALWTTGHVKLKRNKVVEFDDVGVTVDPPNMLTMQNGNGMAVRVVYTGHDPFAHDNRSALASYGGVYQVDAVELPLPSFLMQNWIVREINDAFGAVQLRPYPGHAAVDATTQPVKLSWRISRQTLVDDLPVVGWWDAAASAWSTDGISDVRLNTVDRVISLQSMQLRPLALLHPKTLDCSYRSWGVTSPAPNVARVSVEGGRMVVEIELRDDRCTLVRPQAPELSHLGKPARPAAFLADLKRCGIALMPGSAAKRQDVELFAYRNMARVAGVFPIRFSAWNAKLGPEVTAFELQAGDDAGDRDEWLTICHTSTSAFVGRRCEVWDDDEPEMDGEVRHASLRRALASRTTAEQSARLDTQTTAFVESMRALLTLLRPLASS
ncbi:IC97/Casc1 N-terminal domain-containing protein [Plasmodiophora brassicae]